MTSNKDDIDISVRILEDWNERDGKVYYRWKRTDENASAEEGEWHERLTAFKTKPAFYMKYISPIEYKEKYND